MSRRVATWLAVAIAGSVLAAPARAQTQPPDRPSHIPLPGGSENPEMSLEAFKNRLQQLRFEEVLKKALKEPKQFNLDPEKFKGLQEKDGHPPPQLDLNDQRIREFIEQLNQQYQRDPKERPTEPLDDPQLKALEGLAKQAEQIDTMQKNAGPVKRPGYSPGGPGGSQIPLTQRPDQPSVSPPPKSQPGSSAPPTQEEKEEKQREKATAEILKRLGDSPALTKAIKALTGEGDDDVDTMPAFDDTDDGLDLDRFGKDVGLDRLDRWLPKLDWDKLGGMKMPSHPDNWGPQAAPSAPSAPGFGGGGGPLLYGLLVVFVVGVLIFVAWKLYGWWKEGIRFGAGGGWRLGPWPVQPALVRTREELVRAFEYLSLLRLGQPARNWNHRHIAGRLGDVKSLPAGRVEAAERLAALYEHARYAPAADTMADAQMETARRDLCFLAGVAGA
jgi:hypothetical protein